MEPEQHRELAELLFPDTLYTRAEIEAKYPRRIISPDSWVTRFAPSPTGFIHIGGILTALINRMLTTNSGTYILRIEDTDQKREIKNGIEQIIDALAHVGLLPDEGPYSSNPIRERGSYGPYIQSRRFDIYQVYIKEFVANGFAYPCFLKVEDLDVIRKKQRAMKVRTGIYGTFARDRNIPFNEVVNRIKNGDKSVIRLRATAEPEDRVHIVDRIRGRLEFPANEIDAILMKSDGFPTYHFAHIVDDLLMQVNLVLRGDEWIPSIPLHLAIIKAMQAPHPEYAHIAPIAKIDGSARRKLSKRKDDEAAMAFYYRKGYPIRGVIDYLMNLANSSYEEWHHKNPNADFVEFPFDINRLGKTNALFDIDKFNKISKDVVASYNAKEVYSHIIKWAEFYRPDLLPTLTKDPEYTYNVLNIQRADNALRKDLAKWEDIEVNYGFFFDLPYSYQAKYSEMPKLRMDIIIKILDYFIKAIEVFGSVDKETWLASIRQFSVENNFASKRADLDNSPDHYVGWFGDVMMVYRVAISGRKFTPDLHVVTKVMGPKRVTERLLEAKNFYLNHGEHIPT
jgi:glutamyl-tRNA synthetase